YWSITAYFEKDKEAFEGKFYGINGKKKELANESDVKHILNQLEGKKFTINKVNKRERRRNPAKPFTTSSLQQEAARKLNFRAKKKMMSAQQLYKGIDLERKSGGITRLITNMRTDSTRVSNIAVQEASEYINKTFGASYVGKNRKASQNKGAQDAHEAIRPTS